MTFLCQLPDRTKYALTNSSNIVHVILHNIYHPLDGITPLELPVPSTEPRRSCFSIEPSLHKTWTVSPFRTIQATRITIITLHRESKWSSIKWSIQLNKIRCWKRHLITELPRPFITKHLCGGLEGVILKNTLSSGDQMCFEFERQINRYVLFPLLYFWTPRVHTCSCCFQIYITAN